MTFDDFDTSDFSMSPIIGGDVIVWHLVAEGNTLFIFCDWVQILSHVFVIDVTADVFFIGKSVRTMSVTMALLEGFFDFGSTFAAVDDIGTTIFGNDDTVGCLVDGESAEDVGSTNKDRTTLSHFSCFVVDRLHFSLDFCVRFVSSERVE